MVQWLGTPDTANMETVKQNVLFIFICLYRLAQYNNKPSLQYV